MNFQRKYAESAIINFCLFDALDTKSFKDSVSFTIGQVKIMKDEGSFVNTTNLPTANGLVYSITLTATELTAKRIVLTIVNSNVVSALIVIETYGNTNAMHCFNLDYDFSANTEELKLKKLGIKTITGVALDIENTDPTESLPAMFIHGGSGLQINSTHGYGRAIRVDSAQNTAIEISNVNQPAIVVTSNDSNAIYMSSMEEACVYLDSFSGNVILLENYIGNADGIKINAQGNAINLLSETADALKCTGNLTQKDIRARELIGGTPVTLSDNETNNEIISKSLLESLVDGMPLQTVFELLLCMVNGKFIMDKDTGELTFYKRDNATVLFKVKVTELSRELTVEPSY